MSERLIQDVLGQSSLGADLTEEERARLAALMHLRTVRNAEVVVGEGQSENCLDVLISGELGVFSPATDETISILKPGEFAGTMDFLDGQPRKTTLRAIGDATVATLERSAFETLIDTHPRLVYHVMRDMVRTIYRILLNMDSQCVELTNYVFRQHGRY